MTNYKKTIRKWFLASVNSHAILCVAEDGLVPALSDQRGCSYRLTIIYAGSRPSVRLPELSPGRADPGGSHPLCGGSARGSSPL